MTSCTACPAKGLLSYKLPAIPAAAGIKPKELKTPTWPNSRKKGRGRPSTTRCIEPTRLTALPKKTNCGKRQGLKPLLQVHNFSDILLSSLSYILFDSFPSDPTQVPPRCKTEVYTTIGIAGKACSTWLLYAEYFPICNLDPFEEERERESEQGREFEQEKR
jgi:hypothetical protein